MCYWSQVKLLVANSAVFAGTLPAEWAAPGSFPQLELLSMSMNHISGGASTPAACVQDACNGCKHNGTYSHCAQAFN